MGVKETMTAIADRIRSHTGKTEKLRLRDMPNEIDAACQAEGRRFWDAFQNYGSRNFYDQMFCAQYGGWDDETYNPRYDILCEGSEGARQTFASNRKLTSTKVPIRCKNTRLAYTFAYCTALKTIPLLTLEGITQINNAFTGCNALETITIGGEIPLSIDFQWSAKLTRESIESIVNALSDTATGQTLTLSQAAVDAAFFEEESAGAGSDSGAWAALVESKSNWTITLV